MAHFLSVWTIVFMMVVAAHAGEQSISGIVNTYTRVMLIDAKQCHQFITVASAAGLSPGDLVLIIQMKGAGITIDTTEGFGTITDMNGSGQYEFSRIESVSGNVIALRHTLFNPYDVNEAVQLVRVPQYDDVVVNAPLRARPWDGTTGGVIALDVAGTLRLASDIDASAAGFMNSPMWSTGGECSATFVALPFYSPYGGAKGEGIARPPSGMEAGRGHIANGGGGGVSHNSGGGGGGNGGSGGIGGKQYLNCFKEDLISGGIGGQAIDHLAGVRMILGGAGGNGHQNDGHGAAGGAGGGIIIIRATRFDGAGRVIASNGENGRPGGTNDGGGGGGAGGSIHLQVQDWLTAPRIVARGGNGSDLNHTSPHGPGGGGGGGLVVLSTERPAGVTIDLRGGTNGHNRTFSRSSPHYDYGAASGTEGVTIEGEEISEHTLGNTFTTSLPTDTTVCAGSVVSFTGRPRKGRSPYATIWRRLQSDDIISDSDTLRITAQGTERFIYMATDANGCNIVDTVTLLVTSTFTVPDTVNIGTFVACPDERREATFDIVSDKAAPHGTILAVETTGGVSTTVAAGDTFDGRLTVRVFIDTQSDGPIRGTVRLRIDPCGIDHVVHIVGERRTPAFDGDRNLTFTSQITGNGEVRQVRYYNNGTTDLHVERIEPPAAPFVIISTSPMVPCDLAPGDTLVISILGSAQRWGSFVDSCRVVVTAPCPFVIDTKLSMQIDTHMVVRIPHLTGRAGQRIDIPLLLDTPSAVSFTPDQRYKATIRWPHKVLRPIGTSSGDDIWTTSIDGELVKIVIMGKWSGGDTLAIIPALILLSPLEAIPLDLDDDRPFAWASFPRTTVEQHDGSLTFIDAVCASQFRYGTTFGGAIESITTYPMPLHDEFHVAVRTSVTESVSLVLTDITGRTVTRATGSSETPIRVDASGLAAGHYVLHVMTRYERHDVQIMKLP